MKFYHNLLPVGEHYAEPPQPEDNPERNRLLYLHDDLLRQIFLLEVSVSDSAKARAAASPQLDSLHTALLDARVNLENQGCIL